MLSPFDPRVKSRNPEAFPRVTFPLTVIIRIKTSKVPRPFSGGIANFWLSQVLVDNAYIPGVGPDLITKPWGRQHLRHQYDGVRGLKEL